jgi:hypothetical protein
VARPRARPLRESIVHGLIWLRLIGIKAKVENKGQYDEYVKDLESLRQELGVNLKEDLYPDNPA